MPGVSMKDLTSKAKVAPQEAFVILDLQWVEAKVSSTGSYQVTMVSKRALGLLNPVE